LDEPTKAEMHDETGHRHDKSGKAYAAYGHGVSRAGQPGKASRVTCAIRMEALDTMRYAPAKLTVKSGQTVRFIVTNAGKLKHEFAIGDVEEQRQHEGVRNRLSTFDRGAGGQETVSERLSARGLQ